MREVMIRFQHAVLCHPVVSALVSLLLVIVGAWVSWGKHPMLPLAGRIVVWVALLVTAFFVMSCLVVQALPRFLVGTLTSVYVIALFQLSYELAIPRPQSYIFMFGVTSALLLLNRLLRRGAGDRPRSQFPPVAR
jgi:hypothetical protein